MTNVSVPNPSFDLSNNELDAEHSFHVGATGSGKTSSLTKLSFISESDQVVFFDPYGDYKKIGRSAVKRFTSMPHSFALSFPLGHRKRIKALSLHGHQKKALVKIH